MSSDLSKSKHRATRTAVLIKTHFLTPSLLEQIESLQHCLNRHTNLDLCLSIDLSSGIPDLFPEAKERLKDILIHGFSKDFQLKHGFQIHPHAKKIKAPMNWFHSDYSLLDFFLHTKGSYASLWQIEYDVFLKSGSWDFLAQSFPYDFMAASIKVPDKKYKHKIQGPCLVKPQWYWWNQLIGCEATVGSFFPCIRLGANAADLLVQAYRKGVRGYCEVSVPSILATVGAKICDLSSIDSQQARICHPHWDKEIRSQENTDFQLNTACLDVDP